MQDTCPICQGNNDCGSGFKETGTCWCTEKAFPQEVFRQIPEEYLYKNCICERCLHRITEMEQASKGSADR
ncbi:hypothetical protein SporoP37_03890 [Sporosarcina sp. P37]|uniref:cysteine-rich CWC family protein n=1 Tax=unclassified Sporosarcina TaxID=2647733 RepID=UPI0009BFB2DE|nr:MULTISPECIES: cysteine-rich CWC family protein [unclassified Sporosarcina]ARD47355.1 hypothetical protein SporoP33_03195 [Sporosarcina sp. P33]ARK23922.1 hypothetical protein SporoP37_03890 [Sporosarcina sp. P37]PID17708.1 hypothetical protein CSV62_12060 [Sporosarcina sp. P35]